MPDIAIRKADRQDVGAVARMYDELLDHLATGAEDYTGWEKHVYPRREIAEEGVAAGELYVLTVDGALAASVILNSAQPETYGMVDWRFKAEPGQALVIHTLVVHPNFHGFGAATRLLEFAEGMAREKGMKAVRLDTSNKNTPAASLYEKLGYRLAGVHDLGISVSRHKLFKCYEKAVNVINS